MTPRALGTHAQSEGHLPTHKSTCTWTLCPVNYPAITIQCPHSVFSGSSPPLGLWAEAPWHRESRNHEKRAYTSSRHAHTAEERLCPRAALLLVRGGSLGSQQARCHPHPSGPFSLPPRTLLQPSAGLSLSPGPSRQHTNTLLLLPLKKDTKTSRESSQPTPHPKLPCRPSGWCVSILASPENSWGAVSLVFPLLLFLPVFP